MNPEINLSPDVISTLARGKPGHEDIIEQIVVERKGRPEEEKAFITSLFAFMTLEGDGYVTNMRDAAFNILADTQTQPILKANPRIVWETYIQSVRTQTWENDPYDGSIATLLEAGKVIASTVRPQEEEFDGTIKAWLKVSQDMSYDKDANWIYKAIGEIDKAVGEIEYSVPRQSTIVFDDQVEALTKERLSRQQIAERLNVSLSKIINSKGRLRQAGRVERWQTELDNQVETLSKQELSRQQMAEILNVPLRNIDSSRARLIKAGRVERRWQTTVERRSTASTIELDNQVEALRKQGVKNKQIMKELNISLWVMNNSISRLVMGGRTEKWESVERYQTELDNQVEALSKERLSRQKMAEILNVPLRRIDSSRARLFKAGRVEPKATAPKRKLQKDSLCYRP